MKNKISRDEIVNMILAERQKQVESPTTLSDSMKTKNDWTALAAYYLFESASRPDKHVTFKEFRESLIKASAVLLAALEDEKLQDLLNKLDSNDDNNGTSK
ncbi:hypothetical protein ACUYQI_000780 [Salmonella enterica subsp. enterica serovar Braenderup]